MFPPDSAELRYNIPPDSRPLALHQLEGQLQFERIFWGYKPANWRKPAISNAKIETIVAGRWPWAWLMKQNGRTITPADDWCEWKQLTDDPKGPR